MSNWCPKLDEPILKLPTDKKNNAKFCVEHYEGKGK